jgi:hypothetical protein
LTIVDDHGHTVACWSDANPAGLPADRWLTGAPRTVVSPGWVDAVEGEPTTPANPAVSFRTFTASGRAVYEAVRDAARAAVAGTDRRVVWCPDAATALSDIPSVRSEAQNWTPDDPFDLLIDPAAFLTPAIVPTAEEHLDRVAEAVVSLDRVWAVLIADRVVTDGGLVARAVGDGVLPLPALARCATAAVDRGIPVVLSGEPGVQIERLGLIA